MLRVVPLTTLLSVCFFASPIFAQDWAEKMFDKMEHNFGTVARGADTVYRFEVTNLYKQTMHISGVRSSCGCTDVSIENPTIKTHEKAYIVAKFNTRTFTGRHGATITVTFASPFAAEVQVRVHGNIRSDVVFNPGAIQFGTVDQGSAKQQQVSVSYAGRGNWQILDITNDNDYFEVELTETTRTSRQVAYKLLVRIKDNVPPGYIADQLTVVTNESSAESQRIPLFVEGKVVPEISVTPENLVLGDVEAGAEVVRKVVVRGKTPFKIVDIGCGDNCFQFKTDDQAKKVHLVEITYRAGVNTGKLSSPIHIKTDRGEDRMATCMVSATIVEPTQTLDASSSSSDLDNVESASTATTATTSR